MKKILSLTFCIVMLVTTSIIPTSVSAENKITSENSSVVDLQQSNNCGCRNNQINKKSKTVYITPTGKKYHFRKKCAGKNAIKTTLKKAKKHYKPCKKCANG